ncbi:MAG: hypothetical protein OXS33_02865 [bacterium]|nr:hypothetical protein [bacterium]
MKRRGRWSGIAGLVLLSLIAGSCGGGSDTGGEPAQVTAAADTVPDTTAAPTTTAAAPATTAAASTATTEAATATTSAPTTTAAPDPAPTESEAAPETPAEEPETTTTTTVPPPEPLGPPAPDFTLELSTGETFVLSQQTTPVVIFFWAEW